MKQYITFTEGDIKITMPVGASADDRTWASEDVARIIHASKGTMARLWCGRIECAGCPHWQPEQGVLSVTNYVCTADPMKGLKDE